MYQVCYIKYQVSFYLWQFGPAPKYYGQDCSSFYQSLLKNALSRPEFIFSMEIHVLRNSVKEESEAYTEEPSQTSVMDRFAKIVNG